ncbi:MAG: hypothetical protein JSR54_19595, partial [Proteobacteria bacterium]|nr:hypothetical protein [Pseudomonadota bacterium]
MSAESKDPGGDLWELNIDELFTMDEPEPQAARGAAGPFAIDLAASDEPASELAPVLREFDQLHVYHVTDWKQDRLVFRLRLGPIDSELEADAILSMVRVDYPEARTVAVEDDDRRMIDRVASSASAAGQARPAAP